MSIEGAKVETYEMPVRDLCVEVVRKDIKNLHLGVYPPNGRVRVAVPLRITDDAIQLFVVTRLAWIRRQQAQFAEQERETERQYVSGESHYYRGTRYRLKVIERAEKPHVLVRNRTTIELIVHPGSDRTEREHVLLGWYRRELKAAVEPLLRKWSTAIGVEVASWGIKRMKTKWGTCAIEARRIWLNLELIKKPAHSLEYVVLHEVVHLLERHHTEVFRALMSQHMPLWEQFRAELNRAPLGHEAWGE